MFRLIILASILASASLQQQNGGDLESIINQIFGQPNQTQPQNPVTQNPVPPNPATVDPNRVGPSTIVPPGISDITNDTSCTTEAGEPGECVRYFLCNNNSIITDGVGIIDIRNPASRRPPKTTIALPVLPVNQTLINHNATKSETLRNQNVPTTIRAEILKNQTLVTGSNETMKNQNLTEALKATENDNFREANERFQPDLSVIGIQEQSLYVINDLMRTRRQAGPVRDGPCPSYLDTCCLPPDTRRPDDPITPKPDVPMPNDNNNAAREGCGWRNPEGVGMRTKGDVDGEAKFGEFPWMVAILKVEPVNENEPEGQKLNVYVGGGSLIHPNVVLTAAHYVVAAKELKVRAGEWDTQTVKEIYPYQDRDVTSVVVHKDFNKGNLFYDVALLFLSAPFTPAPNVGVACLPPARERAAAGARCFASGWGKDKFGKEGRYQVILKKVEVPVVERRECQTALRRTRLGRFFELHSSFMCAGGEPGRDTCKGDGGSPLVCPIEFEENRYVQAGIVAWGIGCGEDGTPGVYVDVGNVREWIDDKVKGRGFDTRGYSYTV